jgi:arginase family enzyme
MIQASRDARLTAHDSSCDTRPQLRHKRSATRERLNHGNVVRQLVCSGWLDSVHLVGLRGLCGDRERGELLRTCNVQCLSASEAQRASEPELDDFFRDLEGRRVHLSIDIDVLDPSVAPGTRCLRAGGLLPVDVILRESCGWRRSGPCPASGGPALPASSTAPARHPGRPSCTAASR